MLFKHIAEGFSDFSTIGIYKPTEKFRKILLKRLRTFEFVKLIILKKINKNNRKIEYRQKLMSVKN